MADVILPNYRAEVVNLLFRLLCLEECFVSMRLIFSVVFEYRFDVSGMTRLNTAEYKCILIVVFLNFNLLLSFIIYYQVLGNCQCPVRYFIGAPNIPYRTIFERTLIGRCRP